ncbi:hypothetical protein L2E82_22996 [Cichorium intybus]|uniref:Uncharacterized protein n=1 Tax=Cichorium intybus TaxID=13427 RepID=A0ACB9DZQ0_CICIN|nr:hypothetical protein L2E82_22996 [Cichorium intybus]
MKLQITATGVGLIAVSPSRRCPSFVEKHHPSFPRGCSRFDNVTRLLKSFASFDRRRHFCLRHQHHITPVAALLPLKTIDTLRSGVWKKKKHSDLVMSELSDAISETKPFMQCDFTYRSRVIVLVWTLVAEVVRLPSPFPLHLLFLSDLFSFCRV